MVMNKRGFMRILEAIIAIVLVFGFVVIVMPSKAKNQAEVPPDLEETMKSVLKEMQENPKFRTCVLNGTINFDFVMGGPLETNKSAGCVYSYIDYLSFPMQAHPWSYAVRICEVNKTGDITYCDYFPPQTGTSFEERELGFKNSMALDKNIYLKKEILSYPDIMGPPYPRPNELRIGNYSSLTIYAWLKG
jgi:hypothetical protein